MSDTFLDKQNQIRELFSVCADKEEKYSKIIEIGRESPPLSPDFKLEENTVQGCQSTMYLHSYMKDDKMYFEAESDALISSGLAELLTRVYSGESPETVIKSPPDYLEELEISSSLTPNRANGLYSIHLRMKQDALKELMKAKS